MREAFDQQFYKGQLVNEKNGATLVLISIQKEVLRLQIEELKSSEKSKRRELQAQLDEVNRKDSSYTFMGEVDLFVNEKDSILAEFLIKSNDL